MHISFIIQLIIVILVGEMENVAFFPPSGGELKFWCFQN